ncbi:MAG: type II toxin-antitoxin system RelE/ParE family toxin [Porticoccaceae bacterium]
MEPWLCGTPALPSPRPIAAEYSIDYNQAMFTIRFTTEFSAWLGGIKDGTTRRRLARRLEKAEKGNLGDVKPVGDGIMEMREFFGPGWRMYYVQRGQMLIVMLGGGDKSTQTADIAAAKHLAATVED